MRLGDETHQRQLEVIGEIPTTNKIDVPDFGQYSKDDMEEFERRHLNELAEHTRRYDVNEQLVVAQNLDPFICYNVVGEWMEQTRNQLAQASSLFQTEEEQNG